MQEATSQRIKGIHHISAICSDPQRNLDFYTGLLGLRLVKKTINFDDPGSYHLYYGDGLGNPGTLMTFFAWILPPTVTAQARQGTGQITGTSFRILRAALDFWIDRLADADVRFEGPHERFDEKFISFSDPDGLPLELVARDGSAGRASWRGEKLPEEHAIQGFSGALLCLNGYQHTASLLTQTMGFREVGHEGSRFRFQAGDGDAAAMIDLNCQPEGDSGRIGIGAVHHIAWRAASASELRQWRQILAEAGLDVTPVLDRNYFESIYYREPGGVLFEIATDGPGFTIDESPEELGTSLKLPAWLEPRRSYIEARLPELRLRALSR